MLLGASAIGANDAVEQGWPSTVDELETRTVDRYHENGVADLGRKELETALTTLSAAISDPSVQEQPRSSDTSQR